MLETATSLHSRGEKASLIPSGNNLEARCKESAELGVYYVDASGSRNDRWRYLDRPSGARGLRRAVTTLGSRHAQHDQRGFVDEPATDDRGPPDYEESLLSLSFLDLYHESFAAMVRLVVLLTGSEHSA